MSDDIVARAKAALDGITPGPWRYCRGSNSDPAIMIDVDAWVSGGGLRVAVEDMMEEGEVDPCDIKGWIRDAEFIAQSPELVAELVAEVERLRESGDRLAAMLDECASVIESAEAERRVWVRGLRR